MSDIINIINLCEAQTYDLGKFIKALIEGSDAIKEEKKKTPPEKIYLNKKMIKEKLLSIIKESLGGKISI